MSGHQLELIIAKEALEWFTRSRDGELSSQERATFAAWLASSPKHVEHYLRTAAVSRDLGVAVASLDIDIDALLREADASPDDNVLPLHVPQINSVRKTRHWQSYGHRIAACLVASVLLVGGYTVMIARDGERFGLSKVFTTHAGQQLSWLLPDGSRLSLNTDSRVVVSYSSSERLVKLERGQAFFQVTHDSQRRFRVMAGDGGVIAIGTGFDVRRASRSTEVTVVHGRVAVFTGEPPSTSTLAVASPRQVALNAGQQARIDEDAHAEQPRLSVIAVDIPATVAWLQHEIAFDQRSLASVADEFSRYSGVPIEIQSSRLQSLLISGVFSEYDTESFLQFLTKLDDVEIQRGTDRIVVIDKRQ